MKIHHATGPTQTATCGVRNRVGVIFEKTDWSLVTCQRCLKRYEKANQLIERLTQRSDRRDRGNGYHGSGDDDLLCARLRFDRLTE